MQDADAMVPLPRPFASNRRRRLEPVAGIPHDAPTLIEPGGPVFKVLACCDLRRPVCSGLRRRAVFAPGAEPHSDVLDAIEFAAIVAVGEVIAG